MNPKIKIKKQNKITDTTVLENYTKEELIEKIKSLSAHNLQLHNLITKQTSSDKISSKKTNKFDFSKCTFQHVALHLLYLGWDYKGYVVQEDTLDTVEHHLFEALKKTKLIEDRSTSNYHRCGRTDKGVSSFGQVVSLNLRSISKEERNNKKDEINYCKILNGVLPNDIQCIAWSPMDENFSARFDCSSRTYRYYFPKGELDIQEMIFASKRLLGTHDFRNFCKMDVGNGVVDFTRNISSISIEPVQKNETAYDMYVISIKAKAFLWHQIRCIMGILFLIGQRKEESNIIDELFNIEKYPRKPDYSIASEIPLNLHYCEYGNIKWNYDNEVLNLVIEKLSRSWIFLAIKENMVKGMIDNLQNIRSQEGEIQEKCLSEYLVQSKSKIYVPLLNRQTCDSLEDKIEHYTKRKRIEIVNTDKETE